MHVGITVVRPDRIKLGWDPRPKPDLYEQVYYLLYAIRGVDRVENFSYTTVIDVATHIVPADLLALEIMNALLDDEGVAARVAGNLDVQLLRDCA